MIAQQVAGRATRDALFLSAFGVTSLPGMMAGGAVFSLVAALLLSRMLMRFTPARVVRVAFALGAAVLFATWALSFASPRLAAVALYLYSALYGTAMISAFWSYINETFDPHTSRRSVSTITSGGTVGGLAGGLLAWRAAAVIDVPTMLPFLGGLSLVSFAASIKLKPASPKAPVPEERDAADADQAPGALRLLREAPYLRNLALIVALGAVTSGLIDYVFSAEASKQFSKGPALLSFFALFWVAVGVLSFAVQALLGKVVMERVGLAVTVAILPAVVIFGGAVGLVVPGLWSSAILRASEATHRNSLFRAAYEMLYTPLSEKKKRTLKALIDIGFDRLGTVSAAGIAMVAVAVASSRAEIVILAVAVAAAMFTLACSRPLHTGYVAVLEESLREAAPAKLETPRAAEKLAIRDKIVERLEVLEEGQELAMAPPLADVIDASLQAIADMRPGNAAGARRILCTDAPLPGPLVAFAILLLGDKDSNADAIRALRRGAEKRTGQLVDALRDRDVELDIRRRIPRVLSVCRTQGAANGLIRGLEDDRFEVRYECGRALLKITGGDSPVAVSLEQVVAMVAREVERSKEALASQPPPELDEDEENEPPALVDRLLRDRADRILEHIFTLLALQLDRESLCIAFKGLHEKDERFRGTALEYLETVLPDAIRDAVWPFLGEERPLRSPRPAAEILADLRHASGSQLR